MKNCWPGQKEQFTELLVLRYMFELGEAEPEDLGGNSTRLMSQSKSHKRQQNAGCSMRFVLIMVGHRWALLVGMPFQCHMEVRNSTKDSNLKIGECSYLLGIICLAFFRKFFQAAKKET